MRELYIDWIGLHSAFQMNVPEVRCFLCIEDGKVHKLAPGDAALATVRAETDRYMPIEAVPSRIQYQWLDEFIRTIDDPALRTRLEAAINGKGAFRRFKDILLTLPDERRRWFEFRDQMMRKRIIEWVSEQGVHALNEAPWTTDEPTQEQAPSNDLHDVEALRDLLIEWSDQRGAERPTPLELEELAQEIAKHFSVRALTR